MQVSLRVRKERRLVLPDRIELSTSSLPMKCSTTELRQQTPRHGQPARAAPRRPILATRLTEVQARTPEIGVIGENLHQRAALADRTITIPGRKAWRIVLGESQRIRRDDDAARPDGSPLFYGVDLYSVAITRNPGE